jgi:hypothetical protein
MNKTQLQSNNTRLASLIDELKGKAASGGSSSGGSVETCTVIFNPEIVSTDNPFVTPSYDFFYTGMENSQIKPLWTSIGNESYTISVVKNSSLFIFSNNTPMVNTASSSDGFGTSGGAQYHWGVYEGNGFKSLFFVTDDATITVTYT